MPAGKFRDAAMASLAPEGERAAWACQSSRQRRLAAEANCTLPDFRDYAAEGADKPGLGGRRGDPHRSWEYGSATS